MINSHASQVGCNMPSYKSAFSGMEELKTAFLSGTSSTGKCTHTNNNCNRMKKQHRFMNYYRNIYFGLDAASVPKVQNHQTGA